MWLGEAWRGAARHGLVWQGRVQIMKKGEMRSGKATSDFKRDYSPPDA